MFFVVNSRVYVSCIEMWRLCSLYVPFRERMFTFAA
jgi:hypothetical protein